MQQYNIINWNRAANRSSEETEFLPLSSTPHNEECTQAGQDEQSQILECTALINQLIREQGNPPEEAEFFIIENTGHDFGIYYEVGIFYKTTEETEEAEESKTEIYALNIESNIPDLWDSKAKQELQEAGHPKHQPAKVVLLKRA